jgi:glutathione S-transferase
MFYYFIDAPLGQLPYMTVDGVKLPQSSSIARFLANRFNLAGKDDLEKAKADVIIDTINDLLNSYYTKVFAVPEDQRVNI